MKKILCCLCVCFGAVACGGLENSVAISEVKQETLEEDKHQLSVVIDCRPSGQLSFGDECGGEKVCAEAVWSNGDDEVESVSACKTLDDVGQMTIVIKSQTAVLKGATALKVSLSLDDDSDLWLDDAVYQTQLP